MKLQKVRLTGKRTGLTTYVIPNVGTVSVGDTFEVDEETAERFVTPHATADGKEESDFALSGKPFDADEEPSPVDTEPESAATDAEGGQ